jgi:hypothetical protein
MGLQVISLKRHQTYDRCEFACVMPLGAYVKIANWKIEIPGLGGQIEVKGNLNTADLAGGNFPFPN